MLKVNISYNFFFFFVHDTMVDIKVLSRSPILDTLTTVYFMGQIQRPEPYDYQNECDSEKIRV